MNTARHLLSRVGLGCLALAGQFPPLSAQTPCSSPSWQPATGFRGVDGKINDMILWDRDGAGPEPPSIVAAGGFTIAGTTFANSIALWNGQGWEALGAGVTGEVHRLAVLKDGRLVAGGAFRVTGNLVVNHLAAWDGKAWSALGGGVLSKPPLTTVEVRGLAAMPNGDLVVGGFFHTAGGVVVNSIARWNGLAWSSLGTGLTTTSLTSPGVISDIIAMPNGDIIATGEFDKAGGVAISKLARWNGEKWSALGTNQPAGSLTLMPNGDLVVGGATRWDGVAWSQVGSGALGQRVSSVFKTIALPNGDLVAGGGFTTSSTTPGPANFLAYFNGTTWSGIPGSPDNFVLSLLRLPNGDAVAGGYFTAAGGQHAAGIARWDGANWHIFGSGIGGRVSEPRTDLNIVYASARLPNGNIVIGGRFLGAGTVNASYVAGWTGKTWYPLGAGLNADVHALTVLPNGHVIAGGAFTKSGDVPISGLARWDGQQWTAVGGGVSVAPGSPPRVQALAQMPNGDLVATGFFLKAGAISASGIARWSWLNETWTPLGTGIPAGASSLLALPNGDLIAGGTVAGTGSTNMARWDGAKWSGLGTGMNGPVLSLALAPSGDIIAAGGFGTAGGTVTGGVARWDGAKWSRFGTTNAPGSNAVTILANGKIIIGGRIRPSDITTNNVAEWDGAKWTSLGVGTDRFLGEVHTLTALPEGGFVMGGRFTSVNGQVAVHFAHWGCPFGPVESPALRLRGVSGTPTGGLRFQIEGGAGRALAVEYSEDLRTWRRIMAGTPANAVFEESDVDRKARRQGFYRAVAE